VAPRTLAFAGRDGPSGRVLCDGSIDGGREQFAARRGGLAWSAAGVVGDDELYGFRPLWAGMVGAGRSWMVWMISVLSMPRR
jgi:hypothetical protein